LELVPEVEIKLFSDWSTPAGRPISMKYNKLDKQYNVVRFFEGRHIEFRLPEEEFYPWVPEDVFCYVMKEIVNVSVCTHRVIVALGRLLKHSSS
jgi:hypothetical protein